MKPPMATRARARSPVSIVERLSQEEPRRRLVRPAATAELGVEPALRFFLPGAFGGASADAGGFAGGPARGGLAAAGPVDGQTIATGAPRSALSRSSVSLTPDGGRVPGPVGGRLGHQGHDQLVQLPGISATLALGRGGGSFKWQCISTTGVVPSNGALPTSIWYKHDPERIEVGLVADGRRAPDLLGRHVSRGSQRSAGGRQRRRVQVLGDPEIGQLDLAVGRDHQVRRLQIAVDDAVLVRVVERVADLDSQLDHLAPGQVPALVDELSPGSRPGRTPSRCTTCRGTCPTPGTGRCWDGGTAGGSRPRARTGRSILPPGRTRRS